MVRYTLLAAVPWDAGTGTFRIGKEGFVFILTDLINRGYYVPERGYEFYLWVFNSISHEWAHYYINTSEKSAIYYVTITTVIFPRVKITCYFHLWRYEVFARKLTWNFTGVYKIRSDIFVSFLTSISMSTVILSLGKVTDVCMTGGIIPPVIQNVCKFLNFQPTCSQLLLHLKCWNFAGLLKERCSF